jgi:hypothetical protein
MSNQNNNNGANGAVKIQRAYGVERTFGDIIYNPETKSVFTRIEAGVFSISLTLALREDKKGYDILKPYKAKDGTDQVVKLGKSFPVTDKSGNEVEGLSRFSLGLYREYDKELNKELTRNNDSLFLTIHKLQSPKLIGESGLKKIGWITGQFGIEKVENGKGDNGERRDRVEQAPTEETIDDEEIPF